MIGLLCVLLVSGQGFAKKVYKGDELAEGMGLSYLCSIGTMLELCIKHLPEQSERYGKYLRNWKATLSDSEQFIKRSEKKFNVSCADIQRDVVVAFSRLDENGKTRDCRNFEILFKQNRK